MAASDGSTPERANLDGAKQWSDEQQGVMAALKSVKSRIEAAALASGREPPALIAVSKTKGVPLLQAAYAVGQRCFGENYVHEVVAKAPEMPADARFHFIGHLQTNKVKELLSVPSLECIHTVDSAKLAAELQKRAAQVRRDRPLAVMVQVNTSGEESKSGCAPSEVEKLVAEITSSCALLRVCGLMCIGKYSADEGGAGADFSCLVECRERVAASLGVEAASLSLSMGMSHDFEEAVAAGATHVRVGSTIFGARAPKHAA